MLNRHHLRWFRNTSLTMLATAGCLLAADSVMAYQDNALLSVFSDSTTAPTGNFNFTSSTAVDLSGSNWGFGVDESDVYHAALKHTQNDTPSGGPANRDWEIRLGQGGQIYSIRSEVGEIVPPQSLGRPYNDEVFQSISVDTRHRATGGQAAFYHQSGYYVDNDNVTEPTFAPLLASSSAEPNSWSTLSLAVQADTESNPQQPGGLLNYQRTRDLGDGVIEVTHSIYNFGSNTVDFHNLPWGGVRKTVFDNMLVSNPNGGFTDRQIEDFGDFANQVVEVDDTGGWAAFTEGTAGTDRGLAYVFGDIDTHISESWQARESSWRWGDAGGDFLGIPIRDFNVGTFRREVDVDPGDLFESRYFLVLGDVDHIESTIVGLDLVSSATYDKITISEQDSDLLSWQIVDENGSLSVLESGTGQPSDFMTLALPVNGSTPLFLFEDAEGNEFVSIDPYALSDTPYDGDTDYKSILGFVLPSDVISASGDYVDLQTVFAGRGNYLNTNPSNQFFAISNVASIPEPSAIVLMILATGRWCVRRRPA